MMSEDFFIEKFRNFKGILSYFLFKKSLARPLIKNGGKSPPLFGAPDLNKEKYIFAFCWRH